MNVAIILLMILGGIFWLKGISIAKGKWQTFFALFPVYAWYLVIDE